MGVRASIWLTTACAGLLTVAVSVTSVVRFAYRAPELHVAVETAAGLISLLTAALVLGRFARTLQARDLALAGALAVLAFTNLAFSVGPAVARAATGRFATWAPVGPRLLGALLFAAAALLPDRAVLHPRPAALRLAAGCAAFVGLSAVLVAAAGDSLAPAVPPSLSPTAAGHPRIVGSAVTLAEQLAGMVLYVTAAVGFVRRAERGADLLARWLAIAATLAAFSRLNYFLFPSLYSPWFYTGDVLRLTSFVAVLTGAAAELLRTQRDLAAAAALEERRRIARDIHDGVAQDLAFVVQQGRRLLRRGDVPGLWPLVAAAQGALDESRHAVAALRRPSGRPLPDALAATAQEIAGREGAAVETDLAAGVSVPADTEEALLRIVREATINAIRHGRASVVRIELREHPRLRVAVIDDGRGFDVDAARRGPGRMGLASMAERAQAIGAELSITSVEGSGSRVEVQLR